MNATTLTRDWRYLLAVAMLFMAAVPIRIYAVPGFEITPSLVLAPVAFLLFRPTEKVHYAVVAFMILCAILAMIGEVGIAGRMRNLIGAASYSSGAPYILVGMVFARRTADLGEMWKIIAPVAVAMAIILAIDWFLTGGRLTPSSSYKSVSYTSADSVFVNSFFPFYGKYAVITLATIAMMIGALATASADSFSRKAIGIGVVIASNALIFIAFSMWSRQVMIGTIVFYVFLAALAFRRRETWIAIAVFLVLLAPWAYSQDRPNTMGTYKIARAARNIETGNISDLSTGRVPIYTSTLQKITPRITLIGCGFCDLIDVMKFKFSSLHNVVLTAIFKGGIFYSALYLGAAFCGAMLLWLIKKSFARDVTIAMIFSLGAQSMVNDVLFFQVVPALLFTLTGFLLASTEVTAGRVAGLFVGRRHRRRSREEILGR